MSERPPIPDAASLPILALLQEAADRYVMPRFGQAPDALGLRLKTADDPVTLADTETEAFLLRALRDLAPGIPCVGEETFDEASRSVTNSAGPFFLVDPLDGTRSFSRGDERFALLVALCHERQVRASWMYFPALGVSVKAIVGEEVTLEGPGAGASEAVAEDRHRLEWLGPGERRDLEAALTRAGWRPDEPTCVEFLRIARGQTRCYLCTHTTPWDTAPGVAVARAAGRYVERCDGRPWRPSDEAGTLLFAPDRATFDEVLTRFGLDDLGPARSALGVAMEPAQ